MSNAKIEWKAVGSFNFLEEDTLSPRYEHPLTHACSSSQKKENSTYDTTKVFFNYVFKAIILPILLFERLSKIVMTYLICPYQFFTSEKDFYKERISEIQDLTEQTIKFNSFVLQPEGKSGPQLDGIEIIPQHQKEISPEKQKWLIFSLPNGIIHQEKNIYLFFVAIARMTGLCIATTNYRGARKEPFHRPEKFKDLVKDADTLVKHVTDKGVQPKNCVLWGFSLGGIVAATVAAKHQKPGQEVHYLGENTLDRAEKTASGYASGKAMVKFAKYGIEDYLRPSDEGSKTIKERAYFAIKDIAVCVPHTIFRTIFFATMFFEHLYYAELSKACHSLAEIVKTFIFDPLVLISSIITLLVAPFFDFTHAIKYFNNQLCEEFGDHLVFLIARARYFAWISEKYIVSQGWGTTGAKAWGKIKGEKLASGVKQDSVISWDSSLIKGIYSEYGPNSAEATDTYIHKSKTSSHITPLIQENPQEFFSFLERALKIKFSETIHEITTAQITNLISHSLFTGPKKEDV